MGIDAAPQPDADTLDAARPSKVTFAWNTKSYTWRPKPRFDEFWTFVHGRHEMFMRRTRGDAQPWSSDPYLSSHAYCNVYRVLDRGCQFMLSNVIDQGSQDPQEIVFRVILWHAFYKEDTWKLLCDNFGSPPTWEGFDEAKYNRVLDKAKNAGTKLYTGAFQKPSIRLTGLAHAGHIAVLAAFMNSDFVESIQSAEYASDVYALIKSFPGMGPFNSLQLFLDLSYTKLFNFNQADFVTTGDGSRMGLDLCFGKLGDNEERIAAIRYLTTTQTEHLSRLGLEFAGLGPEKAPMEIVDIEHTLCEFAKYDRYKLRKQKGAYTPSAGIPTAELPKAWTTAERLAAQPKPKPGRYQDLPKRYIIDKIVAEGVDEDDDPIYRIRWLGYGSKDDTWESVAQVEEDAPDVVAEYRQGPPKHQDGDEDEGEDEDGEGSDDPDVAPATPPPPKKIKATPRGRGGARKTGEAVRSSPRKMVGSNVVSTTYGGRKRKRAASLSNGTPSPSPQKRAKTRKSEPSARRRRVEAESDDEAVIDEDEEDELSELSELDLTVVDTNTAAGDDEAQWEVECIVNQRLRGTKGSKTLEYLVQWTGFGEDDRTWEDADNIKKDAPLVWEEWEEKRAGVGAAKKRRKSSA